MNKIKAFLYSGLVILVLSFVACSSMDSSYDQFLKGGEHIYPAKPDSVKIHPGRKRVKLTWRITDESVVKTKIYWRNYTDSVVVPIKREGQKKVMLRRISY